MTRFFLLIFLVIVVKGALVTIEAQTIEEKVHLPRIRTVQIHRQGETLSPPVIALHSGKKITLRFDDLNGGSQTYSYKLIHCNARWEPDDLFESEYISGQMNGEIYHYESSFNTLKAYTHYWLNIPNETMKPAISGNYVLMVYQNYNPSDTVLTRRFRITEDRTRIQADVERINRLSPDKPNQELNLKIHTGNIPVRDPQTNLKIAITKNFHGEKLLEDTRPSSINDNLISYQMNKNLAFRGGNDFHHFNTKNTDFAGENIRAIRFIRNNFHFRLEPDSDRTYQSYKKKQDLNGRFRIDKENADDPRTEADYVFVFFTLKGISFDPEGNYHVAGGFNNWKLNERNRMNYNGEDQNYQKRILLKQGYYDYKYIYQSNNRTHPYRISGNHARTENEYGIYIYFRDYEKGYDRLIGHTLVNSSAVDF